MIQSGLICALVWILMQGTDRLLAWQTLQRPIVTATVTGLLLGDIRTGMIMAASLEAIFMGISAIGGSIPSDACASSIIAVAYTILTGADVETGLALAMPIGTLMGSVNEMWKPVLASFAPYWEKLAASGKEKSFRAQVMFCGFFVDRTTGNHPICSYRIWRKQPGTCHEQFTSIHYGRFIRIQFHDDRYWICDSAFYDLEQRNRMLLLPGICTVQIHVSSNRRNRNHCCCDLHHLLLQ